MAPKTTATASKRARNESKPHKNVHKRAHPVKTMIGKAPATETEAAVGNALSTTAAAAEENVGNTGNDPPVVTSENNRAIFAHLIKLEGKKAPACAVRLTNFFICSILADEQLLATIKNDDFLNACVETVVKKAILFVEVVKISRTHIIALPTSWAAGVTGKLSPDDCKSKLELLQSLHVAVFGKEYTRYEVLVTYREQLVEDRVKKAAKKAAAAVAKEKEAGSSIDGTSLVFRPAGAKA